MTEIIEAPEVVQTPAPLPNTITRRAFQNRFPLVGTASRKYDLMVMFLDKDSYATSLVANAEDRFALQADICAGINRMNVSADVNLDLPDAAYFTGLLMQERVPSAFRLSDEERAAILSTTIADGERP